MPVWQHVLIAACEEVCGRHGGGGFDFPKRERSRAKPRRPTARLENFPTN